MGAYSYKKVKGVQRLVSTVCTQPLEEILVSCIAIEWPANQVYTNRSAGPVPQNPSPLLD